MLLCLSSFFPVLRSEVRADEPESGRLVDEEPNPHITGVVSLTQCLELAQKYNFDVRRIQETLEQRSAEYVQARGQLFPTASALTNYTETDQRRLPAFNGQRFGVEQSWNADLELRQTIFAGGKVAAAYRRAALVARAAELALTEALIEAETSTKVRFYDLVFADAQVKVQEQLVNLRQQLVGQADQRLKAGTVSKFNVLQAEVSFANSKPQLIRAKNEKRLALQELSRVLGATLSDDATVESEEVFQNAPMFYKLPQLLEQSLERPELKRLQLLKEAEQEGVTIARGDFFPQLSAFGQYGTQSSPFSNSVDDRLTGWKAGFQGNWKIFDSFSTIGAVDAAQSRTRQAEIATSDTKATIQINVRRALSRFSQAVELVEASKKVITEAEESLRLAGARSDVGAGIQLDVLEAQVAITEARTNSVQALYEYEVSLAELERAVGRQLRSVPTT